MTTLAEKAQPAVADLLESDEEQLLEQLGIRSRAIEADPAAAGSFDPQVTIDVTSMGPLDTLREIGARIFKRWEKEAFGLICGSDDDDVADRTKLADAFGIGSTAVAALLAAGLVSAFGLAPAIAAVIAAIVIKKFFRPAVDEFCTVWKEHLEPTS